MYVDDLINKIIKGERCFNREGHSAFHVKKEILFNLLPKRDLKSSYFAQKSQERYYSSKKEEKSLCTHSNLFETEEELEEYKDWVYKLISQRPKVVSVDKVYTIEMSKIYQDVETIDYKYWLRTEKRYDSYIDQQKLDSRLLFDWLEYRGFYMKLSITGIGKYLKEEFSYKKRSNTLSHEFWELRESKFLNPYHHHPSYLSLQNEVINRVLKEYKNKDMLSEEGKKEGIRKLNRIRNRIKDRINESNNAVVSRILEKR